jgi:hypothetical protein
VGFWPVLFGGYVACGYLVCFSSQKRRLQNIRLKCDALSDVRKIQVYSSYATVSKPGHFYMCVLCQYTQNPRLKYRNQNQVPSLKERTPRLDRTGHYPTTEKNKTKSDGLPDGHTLRLNLIFECLILNLDSRIKV